MNKTLDLHGTKHENVRRKLDEFFWLLMQKKISEATIITGYSERMKTIVQDTCKEYLFTWNESIHNTGQLNIYL